MIKELFMRLVKAIYYPLCMLFPHKYDKATDIKWFEADAIVGIPFGGHADGKEIGASNAAIARVMIRLHESGTMFREIFDKAPKPLHMAAQWEMTDADPKPRLDVVIGERNNFHISTFEFFYELSRKRPEWRYLIVIAHPDHIWRVKKVAEKFGFVVLVSMAKIKTIPYDLESRQPWCRYKWKFPLGIKAAFRSPENWPFMLWEPFARVHHAIKGWI